MTDFNEISGKQILSLSCAILAITCLTIVVSKLSDNFGIFFCIGIVSAFISFFVFINQTDYYADEESNDVSTIQIIIGIVIIILLVIFMIGVFCHEIRSESTSVTYNAYSMTAPFGMMYRDTEGSISGGAILFIGGMSGNVDTSLSESYEVKYLLDNNLYTVTIDAKNNPIKVDGNFSVTIITTHTYDYNTYWNYDTKLVDTYSTTYQLHIPYLPKLDNQLTEDYTIVP